MPEVVRGHLRHFSFKERSIFNEESISVVMGPKKLIILPSLTPPEGYAETRKWRGPETQRYRYVLAGKRLDSLGNIPLDKLGLTNKGFADPSVFDQLRKAVNNGTYWEYMRSYFGSEWDPDTDSRVPSKKNELAFLLPQFAYTSDSQPLPGYAAIFKENRSLGKKLPVFKLA